MFSIKYIQKRIGIRVLFVLLTLAISASLIEQAVDLLKGKCDIELVEKPIEEKGENFEKEIENEEVEKEKIIQIFSDSHNAEKQNNHNLSFLLNQKAAFGEILSPPPEYLSL